MVVHANIDAVTQSATLFQSNLAPKKYVVVKNHVREINKSNDNSAVEKSDNSKEVTEEKTKTRKRKSKTSNVNQPLQYVEDSEQNPVVGEINQSDLEELRQVYIQCKSVIKKIETKYGHLLNLENDQEYRQNKQFGFDEYGQQFLKDSEYERHIPFNKFGLHQTSSPSDKAHLSIEYSTDFNSDLPNTLEELGNILKEPIDYRLRRFVINKIKGLRQDYMNKLKEDRHLLVKKFKENPSEDLLGFKGTNLSTISGYPR